MKSFQDKVIVITGSGSGIGLALARALGGEGGRIVISDQSGERVEQASATLRSDGVECAGCVCDVTRRDEVEALARFAVEHYGQADVIINNAGIGQVPMGIIDMDVDAFRRVMEVNLFGVLNGIQVFGKLFREQGTPAAIYNVGSENSIYPCVPACHAYVASKHSVLAVTELLAEEVPDFIDVAVIMPGLVETDMTRDLFSGMDADAFAGTIVEQLKQGALYAVSHAYNRVRLDERTARIGQAYDTYAPRYDGDDEFDIRSLISKMS